MKYKKERKDAKEKIETDKKEQKTHKQSFNTDKEERTKKHINKVSLF